MDQYGQAPAAPSAISKYVKYILAILGIIALVLTIAAGVYAFWFFYGKMKQSEIYKPTIAISDDACKLPANAAAKFFSATIKTPDLAKTRQSIVDLIGKYNASITSSSASNDSPERIDQYYRNSSSFTIYVAPEKAEAFVTEVRKIASNFNRLSNEYTQTDTATILSQSCDSAVETLRGLQSKEKIYLNQLTNMTNYTEAKTLIDELTQIRYDAQQQFGFIKDLKENRINKFQISITIEEVPQG